MSGSLIGSFFYQLSVSSRGNGTASLEKAVKIVYVCKSEHCGNVAKRKLGFGKKALGFRYLDLVYIFKKRK